MKSIKFFYKKKLNFTFNKVYFFYWFVNYILIEKNFYYDDWIQIFKFFPSFYTLYYFKIGSNKKKQNFFFNFIKFYITTIIKFKTYLIFPINIEYLCELGIDFSKIFIELFCKPILFKLIFLNTFSKWFYKNNVIYLILKKFNNRLNFFVLDKIFIKKLKNFIYLNNNFFFFKYSLFLKFYFYKKKNISFLNNKNEIMKTKNIKFENNNNKIIVFKKKSFKKLIKYNWNDIINDYIIFY